MRKYVLLGLVIVAVLAMTSVAFAGGYRTWGGSPPDSPHKDYIDAADKCKVCHAVHNANQGNDTWGDPATTLLRTNKANACIYCHITDDVSTLEPYGEVEINYTNDLDWNHDNNHVASGGVSADLYAGCTSCHSVHGATTKIIAGSKILKNNPGRALSAAATTVEQFCRDCHNKSGGNAAGVAGGCGQTGCHEQDNETEGNISTEYWTEARNGVTHVMTATMTGVIDGGAVAWNRNSDTCRDCHYAGAQVSGDSFPHYTSPAIQFLDAGYSVVNSGMDRVCLNCHTDSGNPAAYTSGVGKSF